MAQFIYILMKGIIIITYWTLSINATFYTIDQTKLALIAVPQDVDVDVQKLLLGFNDIQEIDHGSFPLYTSLIILNMDKNPLKFIRDNSFENNANFWIFSCISCQIQILPYDWGPNTPNFGHFYLMFGIDDDVATTIFRYPYFEAFRKIKYIGIRNAPVKTMNNLKLPASINIWFIAYAGLTTFPNLSALNFPFLHTINIEGNTIDVISTDDWTAVSDTLERFKAMHCALTTIPDLSDKPKLWDIDLSDNYLETIPDMLNMTSLTNLKLAGNSRMSCDHRMCWRRLWDRIRAHLTITDDVICVTPPRLAGYQLSAVNPKLMGCAQGIAKSAAHQQVVISSVPCHGRINGLVKWVIIGWDICMPPASRQPII